MIGFEQLYQDCVNAHIDETLTGEYTDDNRDDVRAAILGWFEKTKKYPTPERLAQFGRDVDFLVDHVVIKMTNGKLVVSGNGRAERVLMFLARGTNWYVGNPDIGTLIAEAVFKPR